MLRFLMTLLLLLVAGFPVAGQNAPTSVAEIAADFDPRSTPVKLEVVRTWEEDGMTLQYVTYHIGRFKGQTARMAAFYGYPSGKTNLPGLLHLHGGGQRAFLNEVKHYVKRGYACLSINWGGREMEGAMTGDPNTDWGAVDPTQKNVPGYFNLKPGDKYLDPVESPRNNNWYLLTLGARRGLTVLERQPQIDPDRLGVYGHSMGGNLTVYVAGTDARVKAAVPSAGGQGFRTMPWELLPEQRPRTINGNLKLFQKTLGFQSYAPHIQSPLLWLDATNDFHGIMDDTYRTGQLIPHENVRYSFSPHLNHRFTPPFVVTRSLWLDQHLKHDFEFPQTPGSKMVLENDSQIPVLEVRPDTALAIDRVHILYSIDPDPQARFWRTARAMKLKDNVWSAKLPLLSTDQPLFAFANIHYRLKQPESVPAARPTSTFAVSSRLHTVSPDGLRASSVKATDKISTVIDDFSDGFQDWYRLNADNPHHWQFWTRKITDPKWQGKDNQSLTFDIRTDEPNQLLVIITENFFRSYRGKQRDLIAVVDLPGKGEWHTVSLPPALFKSVDQGDSLVHWRHADLLGLRAYYQDREGNRFGDAQWKGSQPEFSNLRWTATAPK